MANLKLGSKGPSVQKLQQQLTDAGFYSGAIDGSYGPQTQAAVQLLQMSPNSGLKQDGIYGPLTDSYLKSWKPPATSPVASTYDSSGYAIDDLLRSSESDIEPYFNEVAQKDLGDIRGDLQNAQTQYQGYLNDASSKFAADKDAQDLNAAQNGVLFSTGRVQKLNNLQNTYANDQAMKQAQYSNAIGQKARDYQYRQGNDAANSLSDFYKLNSNTYNAQGNKAVVGAGGVSQAYTPSSNNFYGTQNTLKKYYTADRATNKQKATQVPKFLYGNGTAF